MHCNYALHLGWEFIKEKKKVNKKVNTHASTQKRTRSRKHALVHANTHSYQKVPRKKELGQENAHANTQTRARFSWTRACFLVFFYKFPALLEILWTFFHYYQFYLGGPSHRFSSHRSSTLLVQSTQQQV